MKYTLPVLFVYFASGASAAPTQTQGASIDASVVIGAYADHVFQSYTATHAATQRLQLAISDFVKNPTAKTLDAAKTAWTTARILYGETEAFRFYAGPIDAAPSAGRPEGPEGRINAWPLNEAYIDSVKGRLQGGIISDLKVPLTEKALADRNAQNDEANVTLGWHAIEFLLWGQDFSKDGPGMRPVTDFIGDDAIKERRRTYLRVVTDILVKDLALLVDAWAPGQTNYRKEFLDLPSTVALGHIVTGLATLSGFELASERIGVPLDSRSQEDEHSCFSDTTHNDYAANAAGISKTYFGAPGKQSVSLAAFVRAHAPKTAPALEAAIRGSTQLAGSIESPVDQTLLAPDTDPRRQKLQTLSTQLVAQAELLKTLSGPLSISVQVSGE